MFNHLVWLSPFFIHQPDQGAILLPTSSTSLLLTSLICCGLPIWESQRGGRAAAGPWGAHGHVLRPLVCQKHACPQWVRASSQFLGDWGEHSQHFMVNLECLTSKRICNSCNDCLGLCCRFALWPLTVGTQADSVAVPIPSLVSRRFSSTTLPWTASVTTVSSLLPVLPLPSVNLCPAHTDVAFWHEFRFTNSRVHNWLCSVTAPSLCLPAESTWGCLLLGCYRCEYCIAPMAFYTFTWFHKTSDST